MRLRVATLAVLACVFLYAAVRKAGVNPADWNACVIAVGVTVGLYAVLTRGDQAVNVDRTVGICLIALLGLAAFQLAPLPIGAVRVLSPMRAELYSAAAQWADGRAHTLTLSAAPYETAEYIVTLSGYALILLFMAHLRLQSGYASWAVVWPLLFVGGIEAALGCYQVAAGATDGARGTYVSKDHFATLLEMALPFALMYPLAILKRGSRRYQPPIRTVIGVCAAIVIFVLLLSGIILSGSRMGFLASMAAIFVVLAAVVSIRNPHEGPRLSPWLWPRWLTICVLGAVILLGLIYLPTDALIARFAALPHNEGVSTNVRVQIWRDTLRLIGDYPLFGCGLGSYASCFLRYKDVAPMYTVDYAHNDYLQVLAEFGAFGFAAGLIMVIRVVFGTIRGALRGSSADERCIAIACLGSMTAILLHSFVDFNMYVPANGFEFAWILGIALVYTRSRTVQRAVKSSPASPAIERRMDLSSPGRLGRRGAGELTPMEEPERADGRFVFSVS